MSQYEKEESSDRYSLRGKVFHQLREDILSGHYKEHEELREMAISEEMGVSRKILSAGIPISLFQMLNASSSSRYTDGYSLFASRPTTSVRNSQDQWIASVLK